MKAETPASVAAWLKHAERSFRAARLTFGHGAHAAQEEAAWLIAHVLRIPFEQLPLSLERRLTAAQIARIQKLIATRIRTRRPLAYLLREAWLGEHRFYVDERVLVPRSFIAELLHERLRPWIGQPARVRRALDMCTGSGCLAVLLALAFPRAKVDASDISPGALAVARRNVRDYKLTRRVQPLRSNLFADLPAAQYDLIVANPPYVDSRTMKKLPREYRREPRLALAGGADGLDFVKSILRDARDFLRPGGLLVVEIGHNRRALERAFPGVPFTWLETSGGDGFVFLLERGQLPD